MNSYLDLVSRYQHANSKKTRLIIFSVALSVALVTTIFSMFDVFQRTEVIQMKNDYGNYHLLVKDASGEEKAALRSRVDVRNAGELVSFDRGALNDRACQILALEENFAPNFQVEAVEGRYPTQPDELMLERWALEAYQPPLKLGDPVVLRFADGQEHTYRISGLFDDLGNTKAAATPGVILSLPAARAVDVKQASSFLVEFKSGVYVPKARQSVQATLNIPDDRISMNDHLLTAMGQSRHESAISIYTTAGVLFLIVLIAGVVMIYNTFNISVMERVRQFGLLRCIGASKAQIRRIVRREGLRITLWAVPAGLLAGQLVTLICSAFLKYFNHNLFGEIPLFILSLPGLAGGIGIGFLTVLTASHAPANKAASVSPVNAVTGSNEIRPSSKKKSSFLTRRFRVEVALGVNNAITRKKTLLLMAASVALSIILFMGFNVFIQFLYATMKTTKPYTPDISILAEQGLDAGLYQRIGALEGVDRVYGRMFGYVDASFDAGLLNQSYLDLVGGVQVLDNGRFTPREQTWLISYDTDQFGWARRDLVAGTLDETALDQGNGIVAVLNPLRINETSEPVNWHMGDRVVIETAAGPQEKTVMGILRVVPFSDSVLTMTTFITTEKQFTELTGDNRLRVIDVQLKNARQAQTVSEIREMLSPEMSFHDARQKNQEINQTFFSIALFVYGFVAVIAVISVLNVINTIQTNVAARTRYLGVMRAVGMTGAQINRMVLSEVAAYNLLGCVTGMVLGVPLQYELAVRVLAFANIPWTFPWGELVLIAGLVLLFTVLAIIQPLRLIKKRSITEVIGSL